MCAIAHLAENFAIYFVGFATEFQKTHMAMQDCYSDAKKVFFDTTVSAQTLQELISYWEFTYIF